MRVKRLEVQGFKSFKDKTVIHFDHSITGIVGPNGCGKSNIVDAFFWVMGEQSYKHIRGTSSDDLIFNGSSKYAPLGLAEATLVLETSVPDTENAPSGATAANLPVHLRSKEVSVTRRVYRDGSGEYFINGVPARLKDIHEFFMDTGVGAKGYSVIEQGQIGRIVNAKPEERRLLIEEAAGIAKYKARKKESLKKMEATQANLARLNDVVAEIDRNLSSLERQAQKARQYKKYKEELFDKEMTWGRRKSKVLGQKLDLLKTEREALEQELLSLRSALQIEENAIESDRIAQLTDTKTAEDLQNQIQEAAGKLSQAKSALDLSRRRQGDLSQQLESLEDEQHELVASITTENERLAGQEDEVIEAQEEAEIAAVAATTQQELAQEERATFDGARRTLETFKRELLQALSKSAELQSRGAALQSRSESAILQAEKLELQIAQLQERVEGTQIENETAQAAYDEARSQRDLLQTQKQEQQNQVSELESELKQSLASHEQQSKLLNKAKSRLQSLEELDQANEGLADGPKSALEWITQNQKTDQATSLASVLDIQGGYESAVAGWLDTSLEGIISPDLQLAQEMLEHLRQSKKGRASLVIGGLNQPSDSKIPDFDFIKKELVALGIRAEGELSQFVKPLDTNSKAGELAATLVQNVVVLPQLTTALTVEVVSLLTLHQWSAVTLDGQALDTHYGILRGGHASDTASAGSILGRKRTIHELKDQVATLEQTCAEQEDQLEESRAHLENSKETLSTTQHALSEIQMKAAGLERDAHQISRALKEARAQLEQAQLEYSNLTDQAQTAQLDRTETQAHLEELLEKKTELEEKILAHEEQNLSKEATLREQEASLQSLKIREASLKERALGLRRELDAGKKLIGDREKRLAEVQKTLERAVREHGQFNEGDSDLLIQIEELTRGLADQHIDLAQVKDRIEQSNAKLKGSLDRIKELHDTGDSKSAQTNSLSIEVERLSGELTHLVQNLEEKYGQGCLEQPVTSPIQEEMTDPIVTHAMSAEDELLLGEEVERLRDRIRRLGEVNIMAIDEFEEAQRRHEHLLRERADLEQSIKNLEEAIEHINKTSVDRFKRAFDAIADRFERLFPIVFGGGQAKLSLVYPEGADTQDILEAGVDILAQPPGKKVVNIGLLSGGEKALTAVSLIFAIFMVKPSPFCILDEVDAPLDDANIGKFNALLREMSAKSQFIIITHNKKTMELNDTLYGVTMEEPGVSKMVSIEIQ